MDTLLSMKMLEGLELVAVHNFNCFASPIHCIAKILAYPLLYSLKIHIT